MATVPQTIRYGQATTYLMCNDIVKGQLFPPQLSTNQDALMVAIVTDALKWYYEDINPTNPTLQGTANYLYWLCGKYQLAARNLSAGGTVTPIPPSTVMPQPVEFVVDSSTSPIIAGGTSLVIPQFIGFNVVFDRSNVPQTKLVNQSTYYNWNSVTGLFTCYPAAAVDEIFSINPV